MGDKILIADDEPSNRNILSQELTHEGYSVVARPFPRHIGKWHTGTVISAA